MDYAITFDDGSKALMHHGVKGMHWGVWNSETAERYGGRASAARAEGKAKKADRLERKAIRADYGDIVRQGGREAVAANSKKIHVTAAQAAGTGAGITAVKTGLNPVAMGVGAVGSFALTEVVNRGRIYQSGKRNTEAAIRRALKDGKRVDSIDDVYSRDNADRRNKAHGKDIKAVGAGYGTVKPGQGPSARTRRLEQKGKKLEGKLQNLNDNAEYVNRDGRKVYASSVTRARAKHLSKSMREVGAKQYASNARDLGIKPDKATQHNIEIGWESLGRGLKENERRAKKESRK